MTTEPTTITNSGTRAQNPKTLCQLKSRDLPARPRLNHKTFRIDDHLRVRGHQRYRPLTTRNRKAKLQAPVIARPIARFSPPAPSQRCRSVTVRKKSRTPFDPSPRIPPV